MNKRAILLHTIAQHQPIDSARLYQLAKDKTGQTKNAQSVTLAELKKSSLIQADSGHCYSLTDQGRDWIDANPAHGRHLVIDQRAKPASAWMPNIQHQAILETIADNAPLAFKQIADEMHYQGMLRPDVATHVNQLVKADYLERNSAQRFELTETGEQYIERLQADRENDAGDPQPTPRTDPPPTPTTSNRDPAPGVNDTRPPAEARTDLDAMPDPGTLARLRQIHNLAQRNIDAIATTSQRNLSAYRLAEQMIEIRNLTAEIMRAEK